MNGTTMPWGFKCQCGTQHEFDYYVAAHWDELLKFTCPAQGCGCKWKVLRGIVQHEKDHVRAEIIPFAGKDEKRANPKPLEQRRVPRGRIRQRQAPVRDL